MDEKCDPSVCGVYGIDIHKPYDAKMARDAIIKCFIDAHAKELEDLKTYGDIKSEEEFEKIKQMDIEAMIKKIFSDIGEDFNNPTKESLMKIVGALAEFAKNFRNQEIVKKHHDEISSLLDNLKE